VRLHGAGHLTLPMLGEVVHGISTALAHLDADGSTLRSGVTPLVRDE
jgi:triacylglycerol lipase